MVVRKDTVAAFQIIFVSLGCIGISVGRTGVLEIPEQILSVTLIMPDLGGVIGAALLAAFNHSETVCTVRIQILTVILEPCAYRTALTVLQFNGEFCFRSDVIFYRDRIVVYFSSDSFQLSAASGFIGNNVDVSSLAVGDQVFPAIHQRIGQNVCRSGRVRDRDNAFSSVVAFHSLDSDLCGPGCDTSNDTVVHGRYRCIVAVPGDALVLRIPREDRCRQSAAPADLYAEARFVQSHSGNKCRSRDSLVNIYRM